jgi:hypothetical protein
MLRDFSEVLAFFEAEEPEETLTNRSDEGEGETLTRGRPVTEWV